MQVRPSSPSGTAILLLLATIRYCWVAPLGCPMHTMQGWALDESGFSSNDEMLVPGCNTKRLKYYISKPALEETTTQHQEVQWTVMQPKSHKTQTYLHKVHEVGNGWFHTAATPSSPSSWCSWWKKMREHLKCFEAKHVYMKILDSKLDIYPYLRLNQLEQLNWLQ